MQEGPEPESALGCRDFPVQGIAPAAVGASPYSIFEQVGAATPRRDAPGDRKDPNQARSMKRTATAILAALVLSGCSAVSIKYPETPLSAREQQARLLTRDYAVHYSSTITHLLDEAPRTDSDPVVRSGALRLKLGAATEITRASMGLSPVASLLDAWAFAFQLRDFLSNGAGSNLLGKAQPEVRASTEQLADQADAIAKQVLGTDYPRYRAFVVDYAARYPLVSPDCVRTSVLAAWIVEQGDTGPLRAEGTVAQALGDVSDRVRIYSEQIPAMSLWQAELALDRTGFDEASYHNALRNLDTQLERISTLADTSPELAHEAIAELRESLRASSDRLDSSWLQTLRTLRAERIALAANIATERESLTSAFDVQRSRLTDDAGKIAASAVETSWAELRKLVREILLLLGLLTVLVLGLPFAAGYLVGRGRSNR
jgi:hypothetical protein